VDSQQRAEDRKQIWLLGHPQEKKSIFACVSTGIFQFTVHEGILFVFVKLFITKMTWSKMLK
jgi:hypothetical protein